MADENEDARTCGDGSQLGRRVRPVLGYPPAHGQEPDGLAAAWVGRLEL